MAKKVTHVWVFSDTIEKKCMPAQCLHLDNSFYSNYTDAILIGISSAPVTQLD